MSLKIMLKQTLNFVLLQLFKHALGYLIEFLNKSRHTILSTLTNCYRNLKEKLGCFKYS